VKCPKFPEYVLIATGQRRERGRNARNRRA